MGGEKICAGGGGGGAGGTAHKVTWLTGNLVSPTFARDVAFVAKDFFGGGGRGGTTSNKNRSHGKVNTRA